VHIMRWPSPWGEGYPGWHLECSVMSQKYLGQTLDIHGGGMENKFPHHECEIAQAQCITGKPFARYWLHNNMCTLNGQKMGKSLGNAITLKEVFYEGTPHLEKTFEPVVVRHFILTSHYRQPLDFSNQALKAAESGSHKLRDTLRELARAAKQAPEKEPSEQVRQGLAQIESAFREAMDEDFNTAAAIAVVFDFTRLVHEWIAAGVGRSDLAAADTLMRHLTGDVLGFKWPAAVGGGDVEKLDQLIGLLAEIREQARKARDYELADKIRDRLAALGVQLRDTPQGPVW